MAKKNNGKDFLFSDDCGFINGADGNVNLKDAREEGARIQVV